MFRFIKKHPLVTLLLVGGGGLAAATVLASKNVQTPAQPAQGGAQPASPSVLQSLGL